ncbi:MAG: hypothetical protein O9256_01070 [Rhizobiaceae bacterium]|nr:hypothetical protein [Rhizobiaceae bacterium]
MKHHIATVLILVLAMALYAGGLSKPSMALLLLGGAAELWFWVRAVRGPQSGRH